MTGFLAVLLVGLCVLAVAALHDRRTRLAAERAGATPSTIGRPAPPVPDPATRAALEALRTENPRFEARLAHQGFATWSQPPTADLVDADVLCCREAPAGMAEIVGSRAVARRRMRPLVIVCPALDDVTLAEVVVSSGDGSLVVLQADPDAIEAIARLITAQPARRADLQSGASGNFHGRAAHVVADETGSWFAPLEG